MSILNPWSSERDRVAKQLSSKASVKVNDCNNLDDFFRQPSAHELSAVEHLSSSSESRVSEIIADLQKRTSEELAWWSSCSDQSVSIEQNNSEVPIVPNSTEASSTTFSSPSTSNRKPVQTDRGATFLLGAGLVSSPISFLSPSSPYFRNLKLSTSNIVSVIKSKISIRRPRPVAHSASPSQLRCLPGKHDIDVSVPQSNPQQKRDDERQTFERRAEVSPIKPSFQSFLKRVPKPPPRPQSASTGSPATISRQATLTRIFPRSRLGLGHDRFSFEPEDRVQETAAVPEGSVVPKRKPLPKDSPLLIPLSRHPAFAKVPEFDEKIQEVKTKRRDSASDKTHGLEEKLKLLNMLLPLPLTAASPS